MKSSSDDYQLWKKPQPVVVSSKPSTDSVSGLFQTEQRVKQSWRKRWASIFCVTFIVVSIFVGSIVLFEMEALSGGNGDKSSNKKKSVNGTAAIAFSWETLPVFFHSQNGSGLWNEEAVAAVARYPMATFEKAMAAGGSDSQRPQEVHGPATCKQVNARNPNVSTLYYLNSVVDWHWYALHSLLVDNPQYRAKDEFDTDIIILSPDKWAFNLSLSFLADAWIQDCLNATRNGCNGCFIDRANNMTQLSATQRMTAAMGAQFANAHMNALTRLNAGLKQLGAFAVFNNMGNVQIGTSALMIEDFGGSEKCILRLQLAVSRGLVVQARAGHLPLEGAVDCGFENCCDDSDTNALAAFLIGAGIRCYFHCAPWWQSYKEWPEVADFWLDWRPEYDYPLGAPLSNATKDGGIYTREFARGTRVVFDADSGQGTIHWANGLSQTGKPTTVDVRNMACNWQSM